MFAFLASVVAFVSVYYLPVLGIYLAGGVIYAVLKWVIKAVILGSEVKNIELPHNVGGWTEEQKTKYITERREQVAYKHFKQRNYPPLVREAKGRLFAWAVFWPINLIWTMFHDVAKQTFTYLYNKFGSVLQSLSDKILPK